MISKSTSLNRLLDANFNRAREGLRVVEDYARFILDDAKLSKQLKDFRHRLGLLMRVSNDDNALLKARNTPGDVGTIISNKTEQSRATPLATAIASLKRAQEALRVLEEYSKIEAKANAEKFEKMRYALYTIEQQVQTSASLCAKAERLNNARLYTLITKELCAMSPTDTAKAVIDGGVDIIQLREKTMPDKAFLKQAEAIKKITDKSNVILLINDRLPIAELIDADGVHLGQDDLPLKQARQLLGHDKIIGRSTHSVSQARGAKQQGADYIGIGPVWETNTKKHRHAIGLKLLSDVLKQVDIPAFAIGAINRDSIDKVLSTAARQLAICTGITMAKHVKRETAHFKKLVTRN